MFDLNLRFMSYLVCCKLREKGYSRTMEIIGHSFPRRYYCMLHQVLGLSWFGNAACSFLGGYLNVGTHTGAEAVKPA